MLKRKVSQADVARELGVSRQAVSVWARQLAEVNGAVGKLKAKTLGRPKRLTAEQCQLLSRLLIAGALQAGFPTELWTVKRVRAAYFSPSWTAFQADRGRDFSVIVDGVSV
jgi:putative transposase